MNASFSEHRFSGSDGIIYDSLLPCARSPSSKASHSSSAIYDSLQAPILGLSVERAPEQDGAKNLSGGIVTDVSVRGFFMHEQRDAWNDETAHVNVDSLFTDHSSRRGSCSDDKSSIVYSVFFSDMAIMQALSLPEPLPAPILTNCAGHNLSGPERTSRRETTVFTLILSRKLK